MHDTSEKYLLQIHPESPKTEFPVDDFLTRRMETLLYNATKGATYRGWHNCTGCGESSGSSDLIVEGGYITNSLAVHYLRWHRPEVPKSEIDKLTDLSMKMLNALYQ